MDIRTIGTHSGQFHCDEAFAIALLRVLPEFKDSRVIRSRDPKVLATCDILVDVGGQYDPEAFRFDHHQRGFEEVFGEKVEEQIEKSESKIFLLENLRFEKGEIENDKEFSNQITKPFNSYIFDAFGAAHREHASVVSFGENLESFQGPLMDKELHELDRLLNNSESGYAVLLGGAKISDKLNLIEKLLPKVEYLMVGGGMCFTLLKALGHEIGRSLLEESFISKAEELLNSRFGKKIILPIDFGVTD